jgi:glycosyltransferase involved in cell wall biosynthesis
VRILIDALSAREGGGATYIRNISEAIVRAHGDHHFDVLLSSRYQRSIASSLPAEIGRVEVDLPSGPIARRWWYQQTELLRIIRRCRSDVFFAIAEGSYLRVPTRFVTMARNPAIYAALGTFGPRRYRLLRYRLTRQLLVSLSLRRADRVVFVSESFRDQVVRQLRLTPTKTRVVYHGVHPMFGALPAGGAAILDGRPYFISVSNIHPNKNYETLLRAYARLPVDAPELVIAGNASDRPTWRFLQSLVQEMHLGPRVHFLGHVAYDRLPELYRNAVAFVFPSRLETFGHPLVEAMASGTPVIASSLAVCREICQDGALFTEPNDVEGLAEHMRRISEDGELRKRLACRGRTRAASFSWDLSARRLVEVFEELR